MTGCDSQFEPGDLVVLKGLRNKEHLNNNLGTVQKVFPRKSVAPGTRVYSVQITNGMEYPILEENLELLDLKEESMGDSVSETATVEDLQSWHSIDSVDRDGGQGNDASVCEAPAADEQIRDDGRSGTAPADEQIRDDGRSGTATTDEEIPDGFPSDSGLKNGSDFGEVAGDEVASVRSGVGRGSFVGTTDT